MILECACILADAATLEVIDTGAWLVRHETGSVAGAPDFHGELLAACVQSPDAVSLARLEGELMAGPWFKADVVCNRNLWFDKDFLRTHCPQAMRYFPKGEIELGGIEVLSRAAGTPRYEDVVPPPEGGRTYRAGDDVVDAYEAFVHYMRGMRAGVEVAA